MSEILVVTASWAAKSLVDSKLFYPKTLRLPRLDFVTPPPSSP